ncbi:hypothetical protein EJB05_53039, partial [Eragrostis curvula]
MPPPPPGTRLRWASLPEDLIGQIARRVLAGDLLDYVRLRAVCPHWRRSAPSPRGRGIADPRFHPRRWMMLPEGHGLHPGPTKLRGHVRFFNLSTGAVVRARLDPLFRDHCALDSVEGLLLLQRDHDGAVRLLHPFTGDVAEFPPLATLRPYVNLVESDQRCHARKICAASISVDSSADEAVTVMMLLPVTTRAAFATSGDQRWRVSSWSVNQIFRPLPFQGKLYLFRQSSSPYSGPEVLEISPPQQEGTDLILLPPKSIAQSPASSDNFLHRLVECDSEILMVTSDFAPDKKVSVYRLADLALERIAPLTSIGGNSLFVVSVCVSSKAFPAVVGDTIVFTQYNRRYLLQYDLSSGIVSPATDVYTGGCSTLDPLNILYHIFTCCYRQLWNKGQIMFQGVPKGWRVKRKWRQG